MLKQVFVPIAREGWPFIGLFAGITVLLGLWSPPLMFVGIVLTTWCVYFFRDPDRMTPTRDGLVISPADGIVSLITEVAPPKELDIGDTPVKRVSVFMNVFDCHVNRSPVSGKVIRLVYIAGKFLNASLDKASEDNERQLVALEMADGRRVAFVQIAGLVARRIVCYLRDDQDLKTGQRFGMIRFGSRVDVYLPEGVEPLVAVGQRCIAAETVIADLQSEEPARSGEIR